MRNAVVQKCVRGLWTTAIREIKTSLQQTETICDKIQRGTLRWMDMRIVCIHYTAISYQQKCLQCIAVSKGRIGVSIRKHGWIILKKF